MRRLSIYSLQADSSLFLAWVLQQAPYSTETHRRGPLDVFWSSISIDAANRGSEVPVLLTRKPLSRGPRVAESSLRSPFCLQDVCLLVLFMDIHSSRCKLLLTVYYGGFLRSPCEEKKTKNRKTTTCSLKALHAHSSQSLFTSFYLFIYLFGDHFNKKKGVRSG